VVDELEEAELLARSADLMDKLLFGGDIGAIPCYVGQILALAGSNRAGISQAKSIIGGSSGLIVEYTNIRCGKSCEKWTMAGDFAPEVSQASTGLHLHMYLPR
jgi:hypothetical protein